MSTNLPPPAGALRSTERRSLTRRGLGALRRHPVVCLFLLTPGLIEYVGGSRSFVNLVVDPGFFLLQLGINAAMYTSGALLAREAMIRWRKGWPTVFALGAAYAVMEEGIADQTIVNPYAKWSPIHAVGVYGHFLGIDWTWLPDVLFFHILLSIAVPIYLLDLALPEHRGRSLLTRRAIVGVLVLLGLDTAFLTAIVSGLTGYWYGPGMLVALLLAIVALALVAYRLPRYLFPVGAGRPTRSPAAFFLIGAVTYPLMVLVAAVGEADHIVPAVVVLGIVAVPAASFLVFVRAIGSIGRAPHLVAFAAGLVVPGMVIGAVAEWTFPLILVADAATFLFFRWLYRAAPRLEGDGRADPSAGVGAAGPA